MSFCSFSCFSDCVAARPRLVSLQVAAGPGGAGRPVCRVRGPASTQLTLTLDGLSLPANVTRQASVSQIINKSVNSNGQWLLVGSALLITL